MYTIVKIFILLFKKNPRRAVLVYLTKDEMRYRYRHYACM